MFRSGFRHPEASKSKYMYVRLNRRLNSYVPTNGAIPLDDCVRLIAHNISIINVWLSHSKQFITTKLAHYVWINLLHELTRSICYFDQIVENNYLLIISMRPFIGIWPARFCGYSLRCLRAFFCAFLSGHRSVRYISHLVSCVRRNVMSFFSIWEKNRRFIHSSILLAISDSDRHNWSNIEDIWYTRAKAKPSYDETWTSVVFF